MERVARVIAYGLESFICAAYSAFPIIKKLLD